MTIRMPREMSHGAWDPDQYELFADERSRPFFELVSRVRTAAPQSVVDLGCGPGRLTAALAGRWPKAHIEGIDTSAQMIAAAARHAGPRVRFRIGDVADWTPDRPVDVIVSNAVLHWVPTHRDLLPRWIELLNPGGWLAFQVPGNFDAPSHTLLAGLCASPRWRDRVGTAPLRHPVDEPAGYLELLAGHGCRVDAWETTYVQLLQGADPVLEWVKGTALRPVLGVLDERETAEFLAEYAARLREAYPPRPHGTVFAFRRIFVVAQRAA